MISDNSEKPRKRAPGAGRPKKEIPMRQKKIMLPEPLVASVEIELYSDIEGRVPYEAWSNLTTALLSTWLANRRAEQRGGKV